MQEQLPGPFAPGPHLPHHLGRTGRGGGGQPARDLVLAAGRPPVRHPDLVRVSKGLRLNPSQPVYH